jgi:signal transduction histidine kinase/CheY-like chemotaxis protein
MRHGREKTPAKPSLTATLTLSFLAFGAISLSVSSSLQLASVVQAQGRAVANDHRVIAQDAARSVSDFIQDKLDTLKTAVWLTNPYAASGEKQKLDLESLLGLQPSFRELVLLDARDGPQASVSRLAGQRGLPGRLNGDALETARKEGRYISPAYIDPVSGEPLVAVAVPMFDALKDFRGTMAAEVNLSFMWDLVSSLKVRETGYAYVVDRRGTLIAFGDTARVLRGENVGRLRAVAEFLGDASAARTGSAIAYRGIDGKEVVGAFVPLGTPDWAVVTELPWTEAYRDVIRQFVVTAAITLAMAALASLSGLFIARRLTVPLKSLMGIATRIAGGERGLQAAVGGPSEVAGLATAFNSMTAQLKLSLEDLERQYDELKRSQEEKAGLQEQLQQAMKMEAIGQLAGGVAHDFNNLLTVIIGNVDLASLKLDPADPARAFFDPILAAAESAAGLTRQLLAFARRQLIQPKVLCLNELVVKFRKSFIRLLGEDIDLETALDEGLGNARVDPGQIEQILVNLATNARAAMPSGGQILIETSNVRIGEEYCAGHAEARAGDYVLLTVSDTGQGMSEETRSHVFEPFFTTKPAGQGTGLGLATVFGIVKQSQGAIELYSELGHGTQFKIYFPRIMESVDGPGQDKAPGELPTGTQTILVAEDNEEVRRSTVRALETLHYKVLSPSTVNDVLELVAGYPDRIDLLLTDVVMPRMNGPELAERLRALHPETRVLYTSGYTYNIIARHGIVNDGLNFLTKPFTIRELAEKVKQALSP